MAILHKNITAAADIHNPKWFSGANSGDYAFKNEKGELESIDELFLFNSIWESSVCLYVCVCVSILLTIHITPNGEHFLHDCIIFWWNTVHHKEANQHILCAI